MTLTADKRKRVAGECRPWNPKKRRWVIIGEEIVTESSLDGARWILDDPYLSWVPAHNKYQKDALTKRVAELIKAAPACDWVDSADALIEALATGNTAELEQILWELIEGEI